MIDPRAIDAPCPPAHPYWSNGAATIWHGNALDLPLDDASVDLVVTSPPYFGLRSYQDAGEHYTGQIGSEATPAEFVDALIAATREMVRVLKPSGSLWINLGDRYAGGGGQWDKDERDRPMTGQFRTGTGGKTYGLRAKSLIGIPWRYALRCIDDLGLILRAEVIWSKVNGLPESVTDRVRRSHEQWFHFVLQPRYYSAVDEIREASKAGQSASALSFNRVGRETAPGQSCASHRVGRDDQGLNPLGKLPGSVWTINDRESIVGSILRAVAAGALTVEEGERIWLGNSDSGRKSPAQMTAHAGSGSAIPTSVDTVDTGRMPKATGVPIGSLTNSSSDPSQTDSRSTTNATTPPSALADQHARTVDASTPHTSSLRPSRPTSPADSSRRSVQPDTHTTRPTPTCDEPGDESAGHVCVTGCEPPEHVTGPPSVWEVATQPLRVPAHLGIDHFAAFPMAWPRRIITGWSPRDVCGACGDGRRPVADRGDLVPSHPRAMAYAMPRVSPDSKHGLAGSLGFIRERTITGYTCACPDTTAPTTPGVVLDPFMGTGTTLLVASALGRTSHGIDLSGDYCRLAQWRVTDPGEKARALEVDKPPVQIDGQDTLFEAAL